MVPTFQWNFNPSLQHRPFTLFSKISRQKIKRHVYYFKIIEQTNKHDGTDNQPRTSVRELQKRVKYWEKEGNSLNKAGLSKPTTAIRKCWMRTAAHSDASNHLRNTEAELETRRKCASLQAESVKELEESRLTWRTRSRAMSLRSMRNVCRNSKLWGKVQETAAGGGEKVQKQKIKASGGDGGAEGDHTGGQPSPEGTRSCALYLKWSKQASVSTNLVLRSQKKTV